MLTDTEIRKSRPTNKAYRLPDSKGLFLFITPAGGKLWRFKYRHDGKQKLMALGQYPEVPLVLARERHAEARKLLATGVDPMQERKEKKSAAKVAAGDSFETITGLWWEHWRIGKSPRHADMTRRRMEQNVFPVLGSRPIAEIEAPELVEMAKTIEGRGVGDLAKRALESIGQVFRFGVAHGYCKRNPARDVKPSDVLKQTTKTNYARVDAKELPALLRAVECYRGKTLTRLAMKLLALTFVRTSELIGARWDEFDLDARRWNIPAVRMKMKSPHIVPLATQAIEILEMLRTLTGGNEWLFPGDLNRARPMSNNTILKALERMGYKGRMTGHGFRGLASTILHEQGRRHEHIELQLAHSPRNAVSASYNHALYLEPRARMMQDWADFLEKTQRGGKVLPFNRDVA